MVAEYIKFHTKPGDVVFDPFMGSGGVIIEAKKAGRKSIGVDINPITKLIVDNTINDLEPELLQLKLEEIIDEVPREVRNLSLSKCPVCQRECQLQNAIWSNNKIIKVKGYCGEHKQFIKETDSYDLGKAREAKRLLRKYSQDKSYYYPTDRILDFVRRNGKKHINELFSDRNLLQSAAILRIINRVENDALKPFYHMAFTSMLPNVSSMIPANEESVSGKSGWQISKFWVPNSHTEKNVFSSFRSRVNAIHKGKLETKNIFTNAPHKIAIQSSEDLSFIPDNYIDYIFTDPPYGDSIAYLGLSMFWNSWLKYSVDYDAEIIHDPYRKKGDIDYSERLSNVFRELNRVLKPGKKLSFTFHNRYLKFWKIVMDATLDAGFELEDIAWHPQAVASGTQGINRKNTLSGDFVYTFKKPLRVVKKPETLTDVPGEKILNREVAKLFQKSSFIETSKLYEKIIPVIVKKRAFFDLEGKVLDIDKFLSSTYRPSEIKVDNKWLYGWSKT